MTKIFLSLIFSLSILLLTSVAFAQSSEEGIAKKYGITFPVTELGGAQSLEECKSFCSKEENKDACISYAKKKGFYNQSSDGRDHQEYQQHSAKNDEEILKLARAELGCNSYDDCAAFCGSEGNRKKCEDFALNHDLMVGEQKEQMNQVMTDLGCNTPTSCMSFCSSPDNMQKCMIAFQSAGFDTGVHNMTLDECKKLSPPDWECRLDGSTCTCSEPQESPETWCPKAGPDCKWKDNTCFCGETLEEYCAKSPGCKLEGDTCTCTEGSSNEEPVESWCPKAGADCRAEKGQCVCGPNESVQEFCAKQGSNCKVEGDRCVCSEPPAVSSEPIESWCPKVGAGCRAEGESCICDGPENSTPTYGTPVYETPTYQTPSGEYPTPSYPTPYYDMPGYTTPVYPSPESYSTIQGVRTTRGLLPLILDQISGFLPKL